MADQPSIQQLNIEHFNKHSHEVKPHMLALADQVAGYLVQHLPECSRTDTVALEFGCGLGLVSERLAPQVHSMFGVDITPKAVEVRASASLQMLLHVAPVMSHLQV